MGQSHGAGGAGACVIPSEARDLLLAPPEQQIPRCARDDNRGAGGCRHWAGPYLTILPNKCPPAFFPDQVPAYWPR